MACLYPHALGVSSAVILLILANPFFEMPVALHPYSVVTSDSPESVWFDACVLLVQMVMTKSS